MHEYMHIVSNQSMKSWKNRRINAGEHLHSCGCNAKLDKSCYRQCRCLYLGGSQPFQPCITLQEKNIICGTQWWTLTICFKVWWQFENVFLMMY